MKLNEWLGLDPNEKPLDNIVTDGGMCAIFRTLCCIGDSLASGEFEALGKDGTRSYHDQFEYSWGQFIARSCGSKVYNFSRGGMTASEYCDSFAEDKGFWSRDLLAQAYIMALGVNDLFGHNQPVGSVADVDLTDWRNNAPTFAGYYCRIIQRIREMQPHAPFFLVTMPRDASVVDEKRQKHAALLYEIASLFPNVYVIDLLQYAPIFDGAFRERFNLYGHHNPMGYIVLARMIESYIDYIIRHDPKKFRQVGFIGTEFYDEELEK